MGGSLRPLLLWLLLRAGFAGHALEDSGHEIADEEPEATSTSRIELLKAEEFEEKVTDAAGMKGMAPYVPVVLFEAPLCRMCKEAETELETVANNLAAAAEKGQNLDHLAIRIFKLRCEGTEAASHCKRYCTQHPCVVLFTNRKTYLYDRTRAASVMQWWLLRLTRPAVKPLSALSSWQDAAKREVSFLLVHDAKDTTIVAAWREIAIDFLEAASFYTILNENEAERWRIQESPFLLVRGPENLALQSLTFPGPWTKPAMWAWVNFNQFPPVIHLEPYSLSAIFASGLPCVTLLHGGPTKGNLMKDFIMLADALHGSGRFLFGALNVSIVVNWWIVDSHFHLLSPQYTTYPRIFVFQKVDGVLKIWEDPDLTQPSTVNMTVVEALLNSGRAYHDDSLWSKFKYMRKSHYRFMTRDSLGFYVTVFNTLALVFVCTQGKKALAESGKSWPPVEKVD